MIDRFEKFSYAISEISKYWHKIATEEMERHGLKGTHSIYLLALDRHPDGLTAPQLCEACSKDKADVSRMMAVMEKKGLVLKEGVHQKLYRGAFKLTDLGHQAAAHVRTRAERAVEIAGGDLSEETRAIFYAALESITNNLRKLSQDGIPKS